MVENWCESPLGQEYVKEDCGDLISKHDKFGHGLSKEGYRVIFCLAGGLPGWLLGLSSNTMERMADDLDIYCG